MKRLFLSMIIVIIAVMAIVPSAMASGPVEVKEFTCETVILTADDSIQHNESMLRVIIRGKNTKSRTVLSARNAWGFFVAEWDSDDMPHDTYRIVRIKSPHGLDVRMSGNWKVCGKSLRSKNQ
jgi:hypothetical protein